MITTHKFLALAIADIQERIDIKDELLEVYIDPVYKNGMEFSGEVLICGIVKDNTDESTLGSILRDYLKEYVEVAKIRKVQFQKRPEKSVRAAPRLRKVG